MEKIAIPKNLLLALVGGLLVSVVAIAFLLGRESAHPRGLAPQPAQTAAAVDPVRSAAVPTTRDAPPGGDSDVASYFHRMEEIQVGANGGSSQEYANKLLSAAVSGDASGFTDLANGIADAEKKARAITPPSDCTSYHETMLALLAESKSMVTKMKDALERKDANALTSVAGGAASLQSRAEALEAEEKRLKRQHHL